jgi:drug/metabolite transporter (DMT)-like permease
MSTAALFFALAAAAGHAVWNMLLARARNPEAATAVAMLVGVSIFAVPAAIEAEAESSVWPYVAGSALFELAYIVLLAYAYTRSDLSLVYPLGRGVAPVLVLVVGVVFLGAVATGPVVAGVLLIAAGVLFLRGMKGRRDPFGFAAGLAIAGCIAAYTLIDNSGVEHAGVVTYLELVMIPPAIAYAVFILTTQGASAVRAEINAGSLVAGLLILTPYWLFLHALRLAPAAPVAAVRETSIVLATVLGALVLHERVGRERWAGAVLVAAGVAILSL